MQNGDGLPQVLWAEIINAVAYVLNRTGPTKVETKSPYELWHGKNPNVSHLRIIGSTLRPCPQTKEKEVVRESLERTTSRLRH